MEAEATFITKTETTGVELKDKFYIQEADFKSMNSKQKFCQEDNGQDVKGARGCAK